MESELKATREDLQGTIEEQESANEELKAANEEVMSMNEELQSANEELESAKEEMQSLNEELSTVNTQLEHKLQELESANNDITNLLHSTDIAIVFLDRQFRVKLFTPTVERLFSLRETDIGRPIADLSQKSSDVQSAGRLPCGAGQTDPGRTRSLDQWNRHTVRRRTNRL